MFKKVISWLIKTATDSRKGIEDVIISMIPQAAALIAGLVSSILVARGLGPDGMGKYALILSVSGLVTELSDLGIGQTAIRFASRAASLGETQDQFAVLRWAFRLRVSLVFLVTAIAFALAPVVSQKMWHAASLTPLVRLGLWTGIFGAIASVPMIYFQSLKRFKMNTVISVGKTLISLISILVIAWFNIWSLKWVIIASLIGSGLGAFTFLLSVPRATFFTVSEFQQLLRAKLRNFWRAPDQGVANSESPDASGVNSFAFFMLLSTIIVSLILRADVWLMGAFLDKSQLGLYSVATRFTLPLVMVLGALNTALWPRASALTSPQKIKELLQKTFRLSLVVAVGGAIYAIFAPLLTPWVFGSDYGSAILLGQILSLRYCLSILMSPIGVIGYSFGLVRVYWWINVIQLFVVVGVNLLLLSRIGAMGSALALIANEVVGFTIIGIIIRRKVIAMEALATK